VYLPIDTIDWAWREKRKYCKRVKINKCGVDCVFHLTKDSMRFGGNNLSFERSINIYYKTIFNVYCISCIILIVIKDCWQGKFVEECLSH
jgi:hypothetical protein